MRALANPDSIERQAVRILCILYFCRDRPDTPPCRLFGDETHVIDTETKLQKIDFWIRNPDHLAAALLHFCEQGKLSSALAETDEVKECIRRIFQDQEPVLRLVPMHKYLWGAYEPLDNVMSFLSSRSLAHRRMGGHQTEYILLTKSRDAVARMLQECREIHWYADRCRMINRYFGQLSGLGLRTVQYLESDYKDTPYLQVIGSIENEVRQRFQKLFGEAL